MIPSGHSPAYPPTHHFPSPAKVALAPRWLWPQLAGVTLGLPLLLLPLSLGQAENQAPKPLRAEPHHPLASFPGWEGQLAAAQCPLVVRICTACPAPELLHSPHPFWKKAPQGPRLGICSP